MEEGNEKAKLDVENITFEPTQESPKTSIEVGKVQQDQIKKMAAKLGWGEDEDEYEAPSLLGTLKTDRDPMAGVKTLDSNPGQGLKTLDDPEDFDIFDEEEEKEEATISINSEGEEIETLDLDDLSNVEEEVTEQEYQRLIAAQKKLRKLQEEEEKAERVALKAQQKAEKKLAAAEKKKRKKEEKKQKKIEKENFGKLLEPKINPSITVLMPTHNPGRKIFTEQLKSIDAQSYKNVSILILDDASDVISKEDLERVVSNIVVNFEVKVERNETRLGRDKSYEKLIEMAQTDLIAFATHRDIWDKDRLKRMVLALENEEEATIVYSDARIIDEKGELVAKSLSNYGLFEEFKAGDHPIRAFVASNPIKLETALINTDKAKKALPLAPDLSIDHYLAFRLSLEGKIIFVGRPLIDKRLHLLHDAEIDKKRIRFDKQSYIDENIGKKIAGLKWIEREVELAPEVYEVLEEAIIWLMARRENMRGKKGYFKELWENKDFGVNSLKFELKMSKLSDTSFEEEYKKHVMSLLSPSPEFIRKEAAEKEWGKFKEKIGKLFERKPPKVKKGTRMVNAAVKREIEQKLKAEAEKVAAQAETETTKEETKDDKKA